MALDIVLITIWNIVVLPLLKNVDNLNFVLCLFNKETKFDHILQKLMLCMF
jgi:hypothetical protein